MSQEQVTQSAIMSFQTVEKAITSWKSILESTDGIFTFEELSEKGFDKHPWHNLIALRSVGFLSTQGQRGALSVKLSDLGKRFAKSRKPETKEEVYLEGVRTLPGYSIFKTRALHDNAPDMESLARSFFSAVNGKVSDKRVMMNVCNRYMQAWKAEGGEEAFLAEEAAAMLSGREGVPGVIVNHWRMGGASDFDSVSLLTSAVAYNEALRMVGDKVSPTLIGWAILNKMVEQEKIQSDMSLHWKMPECFDEDTQKNVLASLDSGKITDPKIAVHCAFNIILNLRGLNIPQGLSKNDTYCSVSKSGEPISLQVHSNKAMLSDEKISIGASFIEQGSFYCDELLVNLPSKGVNTDFGVLRRTGTNQGVGLFFDKGEKVEGGHLEVNLLQVKENLCKVSCDSKSSFSINGIEGFLTSCALFSSDVNEGLYDDTDKAQFAACWMLREARRSCLGASLKGTKTCSLFGTEVSLVEIEEVLKKSEVSIRKKMGFKWRNMEEDFIAKFMLPDNDLMAWKKLKRLLTTDFLGQTKGSPASGLALIAANESERSAESLQNAVEHDLAKLPAEMKVTFFESSDYSLCESLKKAWNELPEQPKSKRKLK